MLQVDVRGAVAQLQPVHRADAQPVEPQVRQPDHSFSRLLGAELLQLGLVEATLGDEPHGEQPRLRRRRLRGRVWVLLEQRGVIWVQRRQLDVLKRVVLHRRSRCRWGCQHDARVGENSGRGSYRSNLLVRGNACTTPVPSI